MTVTCKYRYQLPLTVVLTSAASLGFFGMYLDGVSRHHCDRDSHAIQQSRVLLSEQAFGLTTLEFDVWQAGLVPGTVITVYNAVRKINANFIIQSVEGFFQGGGVAGTVRYHVVCGAWHWNVVDVLMSMLSGEPLDTNIDGSGNPIQVPDVPGENLTSPSLLPHRPGRKVATIPERPRLEMDMTHTQVWPVYRRQYETELQMGREERNPTGLYEVQLTRYNIWTNYGLTALAAVPGGQPYTPPQYLAIENNGVAMTNAGGISAAATSCTAATNPLESGDTQLILGVGTPNQETVTGVTVTGTGPYTFHFTACTKTHAINDPLCRVPLVATRGNLQNEWQYDSVNNPNQRLFSSAGFHRDRGMGDAVLLQRGSGSRKHHHHRPLDSETVGTGNLHNHLALGYVHTSSSDLEIDATLTLVN